MTNNAFVLYVRQGKLGRYNFLRLVVIRVTLRYCQPIFYGHSIHLRVFGALSPSSSMTRGASCGHVHEAILLMLNIVHGTKDSVSRCVTFD